METTPAYNRTSEMCGSSDDHVYSLLFLDEKHNNNKNLAAKSALSHYVGCASLAASSARHAGIELTVLTNRAEELTELACKRGVPGFKVREVQFDSSIPTGIRYFQAHFKIQVLKMFATGAFGGHPTLVDNDVFVQRNFLPKSGGHDLLIYDISHKSSHLEHDLNLMLPGGNGLVAGGPAANLSRRLRRHLVS